MKPTRDEIARLAFAKYLLTLAERHIVLPEPLASVSLLLLHDAVEHLLVLSCYHVGADPRNSQFIGYWDLIAKSTAARHLPEKGRMDAFNVARVALKHKGVQPSRMQLGEFQNLILGFFNDVIPLVFDVSFASINLTAFVVNEDARKRLENATNANHEGRYGDAVTEAAYAFDDLRASSPLADYMQRLARTNLERIEVLTNI